MLITLVKHLPNAISKKTLSFVPHSGQCQWKCKPIFGDIGNDFSGIGFVSFDSELELTTDKWAFAHNKLAQFNEAAIEVDELFPKLSQP